MGLDVGKKRIGVAVSDELSLTAGGLSHIKRSSLNKDMEEIVILLKEHSVSLIVVGMPVNMDGSTGAQARYTEKFILALKEKTNIDIIKWDERLSTIAVTRILIEGDVSRKKRKTKVDQLSASYILQGYLDSKGKQ